MQSSTKEALRQSANALISATTDIEAAHQKFTTKCQTRFESNPEGMTPENYLAEANAIWDEVKIQHGAKPAQGEQAAARS